MKKKKILIVASRYYPNIIKKKIEIISKILEKDNIFYKVIMVPGSYEIPLAISKNIKSYNGCIALGCIIKGKTNHNQLIAQAIFNGLINIMLKSKKPIANGILTTNTLAQARNRIKKKSFESIKAIKSFI
ncbi:MAG: 6,7-dimethyl-8-ribityllumazine synthase [Candidatus Pelagibacter sp.]|nr:6,7-dimethyl-8-ribityllumazine synthase [Candidatus Pelagibacter sp.]